MIPEGKYNAVAVPVEGDSFVEWGETKAGEPKISMRFKLSTGETIYWYGYFSENARDRTVKALRLVGFVGDSLADASNQRLNQPVQLVIKHEEYNGKTSAKVQYVNPPRAAFDSSKLSKFSAEMRAAVAN